MFKFMLMLVTGSLAADVTPFNRGFDMPEPTLVEQASLQVHLHHTVVRASDAKRSEIAVSWITPTVAKCKPVVTISPAAGVTQNGATRTYGDALLADGKSQASFQHVVIAGLREGASYNYTVACAGQSKTSVFVAPRLACAPSDSYSFAVFGDMGTSKAAHDTVNSIAAAGGVAGGLDGVFLIGDISYASLSHNNNEKIWNQFLAMIEPVASSVPWAVMPGNHDMREGDSKNECGLQMLSRFETPSARAAQPHLLSLDDPARCADSFNNTVGAPWWWAVDAGHARVITFSTDSNLTKGSVQWEWLAGELAAANRPEERAVHPWVILMGHKPMYTADKYSGEYGTRGSATAGEGTEGQLTAELEDLFVMNKVDVAFYGHMHSYNRMFPVKNNGSYVETGPDTKVYRSPQAPVHMMIGMAGAGHLGAPYATPAWSAYHEISYGWLRATFANSSALHLEFVANGDGLTGEYSPSVHDDVWITK